MKTKKLIIWLVIVVVVIVLIFTLMEHPTVIGDFISGFKDGYETDRWS